MTKNELNNVDDYKRIQDEKSSLDDQISTTEKKLKELEDEKDPSDDDKAKIESYKQELNTLRGSYEDLNDEEKKYTDPEAYAADMKAKAASILIVDNAISDYTDSLAKLGSTLTRINKLEDINSMSLADKMELLADYPELLGAMERGALDAATMLDVLNTKFNDTMSELDEDIKNKKQLYGDQT